jgi:hypothetical protein
MMIGRVDSGVARFGLPGVVLGMALAWGSSFHGEQASAQTGGPRPSASSGGTARPAEATKPQAARTVAGSDSSGTLALVTSSLGPVQWLYLIDTKKRAFAVYRIDPANPKGTVKLEASRQYRWDLELDQYNNQGLEPSDVEARVMALPRTTR